MRLLRAFACLCEEQSVSRAASRMHVTQSAMSGILGRLREAFDDNLFERTRNGLRPTARSIALLPAVTDILGRIDALGSQQEFDPASARNVISIAANDFIQSILLAPVVCDVHAQAPGMQLQFRQLNADRLKADLLRGELDLALIAQQHAPRELPSAIVLEQDYALAVGLRHRLSGRSSISVADIADETHIAISPAPDGSNWHIDQAFERAGIPRKVAVLVSTFLAVPDLLEAADFIAVLPAQLAQRHRDRLAVLPLPVDIASSALVMLWNQQSRNEPANRWMRERILAAADALSSQVEPGSRQDQRVKPATGIATGFARTVK
ncbi:MAG: LysR family transcriptional regulator [Hyphomicrobiales bacterium]|nr:LysR family transcriptional regulator [Hyphomicrobiales bacterium]